MTLLSQNMPFKNESDDLFDHTVHDIQDQNISSGQKLKGYWTLTKPRLSMLVSFSSAFGYMLAVSGKPDYLILFMLSLGGFFISGAAVVINQLFEIKEDGLMSRTKDRPLVTGVVSKTEAIYFTILLFVIGLGMLFYYTHWLTGVLSFVSVILYSFVYTPLKKVGPIAVFVGAFPGALPPLLGWVAYTGTIDVMAWVLFGIQFIWQFPHFWAIAWVAHDDYKKAGFRLLPGRGERDLYTAIQMMSYTLILIPLGIVPAKLGVTGMDSALVAVGCGTLFLIQTFSLLKNQDRKSALKIMFGSFLYLPIVQIAYLVDKI